MVECLKATSKLRVCSSHTSMDVASIDADNASSLDRGDIVSTTSEANQKMETPVPLAVYVHVKGEGISNHKQSISQDNTLPAL